MYYVMSVDKVGNPTIQLSGPHATYRMAYNNLISLWEKTTVRFIDFHATVIRKG